MSTIAPEKLPAQLADAFLAAADGRKKSAAFEIRWFNLCGLTRPSAASWRACRMPAVLEGEEEDDRAPTVVLFVPL